MMRADDDVATLARPPARPAVRTEMAGFIQLADSPVKGRDGQAGVSRVNGGSKLAGT